MSKNSIPTHVVLFPDGNRRWARERGIPQLRGHKAGYDKLKEFANWCIDRGVKVVTAFGFSTENWNRSKAEVSYLMRLLEKGILELYRDYKNKGQLRVIGQRDRLPKSLQQAIQKVEEGTKHNDKFFLNLAISYGGRWDIVQAVQKILQEKKDPKAITEEFFNAYLSTSGLPDPDLVIRAGGEKRFSNFLLWQSAYAELYFCPKYWPAFQEQDLNDAFEEYAKRHRRFGQ